MGEQPIPDGVLHRKQGTQDTIAIQHIDGMTIEVRSGRFDGVTVTAANGRMLHKNHQVVTEDLETGERSNLIISNALGESKRGVESKEIGAAMDEAVKRAFADSVLSSGKVSPGNLSTTEAKQFRKVAELISQSIVDEQFSTNKVSNIVAALAKIAPQARGGRE